MKIRILIGLITLAIAAWCGWLTRGWFEDAQQLTEERAARLVADAAMAREADIASVVESRLAELDANERIIDRGVIREIQKPIYRRVCLGDDAIRLLNDAAAGGAPNSAEPQAQMPDHAAGTH
ncbi:hypothetical protein [Salinicola rhizosphaerae]|uniref:DUF2570 domain-containing protein n=1 Tax=Salinicola rhizosphaerae TaxID=1443141 RepID=A0ABQ3EJN5_9GAMM|nr:hypothetical protein [Salinicola rhizosphaerae]GHB32863.1 hypothetical protein GCM10009038_34740 [Salinicola rhizosphaerae]